MAIFTGNAHLVHSTVAEIVLLPLVATAALNPDGELSLLMGVVAAHAVIVLMGTGQKLVVLAVFLNKAKLGRNYRSVVATGMATAATASASTACTVITSPPACLTISMQVLALVCLGISRP